MFFVHLDIHIYHTAVTDLSIKSLSKGTMLIYRRTMINTLHQGWFDGLRREREDDSENNERLIQRAENCVKHKQRCKTTACCMKEHLKEDWRAHRKVAFAEAKADLVAWCYWLHNTSWGWFDRWTLSYVSSHRLFCTDFLNPFSS